MLSRHSFIQTVAGALVLLVLLTPLVAGAQGNLAALSWVTVDTTITATSQTVRWAAVDRAGPAGSRILLRTERRTAQAGSETGSTRVARLTCDSMALRSEVVAFGRGTGDAVALAPAAPEYIEAFLSTMQTEYEASPMLRARYASFDAMLRAGAQRECEAAGGALRRAGQLPAT